MSIFRREHPALHDDHTDRTDEVVVTETTDEEHAHDMFGGTHWGAAFFGWLVAIALTVLLAAVVSAAASAIGAEADWTLARAEQEAGAVGLAAAIALVVVMLVAYYAGGYVAGRMSRFDGGRQGLAVWLIGVIVTLAAGGLGALFGDQYDVLRRIDLPSLPISGDTATWGGVITGVVLLVVTLLAAMAGGKVGQRYHVKVDRVYH